MAKTSERLSALKLANLKDPGYFPDGGNLYFRIAQGGSRGWIFRFTMQGCSRDMGLGAYPRSACPPRASSLPNSASWSRKGPTRLRGGMPIALPSELPPPRA